MEFVLEARARQVKILKNDESENRETPEMPLVFIFSKFFRINLLQS